MAAFQCVQSRSQAVALQGGALYVHKVQVKILTGAAQYLGTPY